jgi:hypothetical protein
MTMHFSTDSNTRDSRLAKIRARRGTPERQALIDEMQAAKLKKKTAAASTGRKTPANSEEMFGHTWPEWFEMRDAGYQHILGCAREGKKTTEREVWAAVQKQLGKDLGSHSRQLPHLLVHITEHVYPTAGVIPSAIVIDKKGDEHPGARFFRRAAALGALPKKDAPATGETWTEMTPNQRAFWEDQVGRMFAAETAEAAPSDQ